MVGMYMSLCQQPPSRIGWTVCVTYQTSSNWDLRPLVLFNGVINNDGL